MLKSYRRLLWGFALGTPLLVGSCAHQAPRADKASGGSKLAAKGDAGAARDEDDDAEDSEEEAEEEDVANTEPVENTPEDLEPEVVSSDLRKEEIEADRLARQTFPLVQNEFVDKWITYFTGRGRKTFERWLGRSTRFIPLMKDVLRQDGLPEDLIYLSMIESGFNVKAKSHAKAVGPWQFIKRTGTRYDLEVGYWVDERRDFVKSSHAAATYLKELHQIFGSWYLAAAAYNAGEGKVLAAVRRDRSRNFWELSRKKKNFRSETRNYVPKIIAAALISKNPERYGFAEIAYEEPLDWDFVQVPETVDLRGVAEVTGVDPEKLEILNAELVRGLTPPKRGPYSIKVPKEAKERLIASIDKIPAKKMKDMVLHTIRRGDSLGSIARRYGSDVQEIMELNGLKSAKRLRLGQELSIPVRERASRGRRSTPRSGARSRNAEPVARAARASGRTPASTRAPASHVVRRGENLTSIAHRYGFTVPQLRSVNPGLGTKGAVRVGQRLKLPN